MRTHQTGQTSPTLRDGKSRNSRNYISDVTFIPIPEKYRGLKSINTGKFNTVRQLIRLLDIRLFCGTQCSALHRGAKPGQLANRDIYFLPTSFKSPHSLRTSQTRDTAYYSLSFALFLPKGASKAKIVWHLSMLL